jgi:hypothetical protein
VDDEQRAARGLTIGVMVVAALVGSVLVSLDPDDAEPRSAAIVAVTDTLVTTTTPPTSTPPTTGAGAGASSSTTTTPPATSTTDGATADPGALPQTDERPTASGATFTAGVDDLWDAIKQDEPERGLPFFFPKSAYLQVKAIDDPAGDYQNRLITNFEDDVHTLHAQLGPNAASAKLVGITVPDDQAVFVQPGEEYNQLSYWRVYGTTMQYEVDGHTGSFPVTSLISWRGQWYVVHLGTIR